MITLTLEEQNGQSMVVGEFKTLEDVNAKIKSLDAAWERGPFYGSAISKDDVKVLAKWEGCELSVVLDGATFMYLDEEWEKI